MRILVIDDDQELNEILTEYLKKFGFEVSTANRYEAGLSLFRNFKPHLVVLDIMMPGKNGFEVCKEIRKESNTPILFLSARGEVNDRIVGLELGGDDYLPKPYEPRELVARIQSILRRTQEKPTGNSVLVSQDLVLDLKKRIAIFQKNALELTTMEFELLKLFMQNPGKTLSRDEIMDQIRGIQWDCFDRSIDVAMSRLRQKLADHPKKPSYLKTVWGSGYIFVGEVSHDL